MASFTSRTRHAVAVCLCNIGCLSNIWLDTKTLRYIVDVNNGQCHGSRAKQLTLSKVETLRESHALSAKSKRLWYRVSDRFCKNIIYRLRKAHIEQSSNLPILVHHFESHGAPPLSKQVSHRVAEECKSWWEIEPLSS